MTVIGLQVLLAGYNLARKGGEVPGHKPKTNCVGQYLAGALVSVFLVVLVGVWAVATVLTAGSIVSADVCAALATTRYPGTA